MKKIARLAQQFYENILDDEPLFVSDETTVWSVSGAEPEELLAKILEYYGKTVSMTELQRQRGAESHIPIRELSGLGLRSLQSYVSELAWSQRKTQKE
jgi:hypothetical protein